MFWDDGNTNISNFKIIYLILFFWIFLFILYKFVKFTGKNNRKITFKYTKNRKNKFHNEKLQKRNDKSSFSKFSNIRME